MALPQIPLNGRCAGDNRRSTDGSASTRSDCSGPKRGSQARPWVTIGNYLPVHYRGSPHSRLLLRCGCVEACHCAQRAGVRQTFCQTHCARRPEAGPDPVERDYRFCFLLFGGVLRIRRGTLLPEARQRARGRSDRRPVSPRHVCLLHPAHAVFRRQQLSARP